MLKFIHLCISKDHGQKESLRNLLFCIDIDLTFGSNRLFKINLQDYQMAKYTMNQWSDIKMNMKYKNVFDLIVIWMKSDIVLTWSPIC